MQPGQVISPGPSDPDNSPENQQPVSDTSTTNVQPPTTSPQPQPGQSEPEEQPLATQPEPVQPPVPQLAPNGQQGQDQPATYDAAPPLLSWEASEYMEHSKTSLWYLGLGTIALGLAAFLALVFKEWLSATVVVLMAVALGVYGRKAPRVLRYSLSEPGVSIGEKFYPYEEFRGYAVVQSQGLLTIELDPVKRFMPRLSMFFEPDKLDQIVDILDVRLPREERAPDAIDRISQKLKF